MANLLAWIARSRWAPLMALGALVVAAFLPREGVGLPVCTFKALTHLPCPGCGLTRSMIHMAHGEFRAAALYHPLGILLFVMIAAAASLLLVPPARRGQVAAWLEARSRVANGLGVAAGVLLVGYGIGRLVWIACTGRSLW